MRYELLVGMYCFVYKYIDYLVFQKKKVFQKNISTILEICLVCKLVGIALRLGMRRLRCVDIGVTFSFVCQFLDVLIVRHVSVSTADIGHSELLFYKFDKLK